MRLSHWACQRFANVCPFVKLQMELDMASEHGLQQDRPGKAPQTSEPLIEQVAVSISICATITLSQTLFATSGDRGASSKLRPQALLSSPRRRSLRLILAAAIPSDAARILTVHQLTPELAEPVSEVDLVIFINASHVREPGTWRCDQAKPRCASGNSLGHHFDVAGLFAYSRPPLMPLLKGSFFQ